MCKYTLCSKSGIMFVGQVQPEQYFCVICYLFSKEGVSTAVRVNFSCTLHLPSTAPAETQISEGLILLLSLCEGLPQEPNNLFSSITISILCPGASQLQPWFTQGPVTMLDLQRGPSIHLSNLICISLPFQGMLASLTFQTILISPPFHKPGLLLTCQHIPGIMAIRMSCYTERWSRAAPQGKSWLWSSSFPILLHCLSLQQFVHGAIAQHQPH